MVVTWNIEGAARGCRSLQHFTSLYTPALIFLSEPQMFRCGVKTLFFRPQGYCFHFNGEDVKHPDLPLDTLRAKGGTAVGWLAELDPFIQVLEPPSSAVLPLLLSLPGCKLSLHIGVYLPTRGQELEWTIALAEVKSVIAAVNEEHGDFDVFIRGDANVGPSHPSRPALFANFLADLGIVSRDLYHPTYHHFMGDGASDSQLDVLCAPAQVMDSVVEVVCKHEDPLVCSSHDLIVSKFSPVPSISPASPSPPAPRAILSRVRVRWDPDDLESYTAKLAVSLPALLEAFPSVSSPEALSSLLKSSNSIFVDAAKSCFPFTDTLSPPKPKSPKPDHLLRAYSSAIRRLSISIRRGSTPALVAERAKLSKKYFRRSRALKLRALREREDKAKQALLKNPRSFYAFVRQSRQAAQGLPNVLHVGDLQFKGDAVPDGFFSFFV